MKSVCSSTAALSRAWPQWFVVPLLLVFGGCSFSAVHNDCLTDDDCPDGLRCAYELCLTPEELDMFSNRDRPDAMDASTPDNTPSDMSETDMRSQLLDMSETDMSVSIPDMFVGVPDMSDEPDMTVSNCIVDPFNIICSTDPNEPNGSFATSTGIGQTGGCVVLDPFAMTDETIEGELCRDDEDWFAQNFVQCEERSLTIEFIARPLVSCRHSDWSLRVFNQQCAATNVQCEDRMDGSKSVTVVYPPVDRASIRRANAVLEADTDVKLPYELQVMVR